MTRFAQRRRFWKSTLVVAFILTALTPGRIFGQAFLAKWMQAGSYHNWYANFGSEIEEGLQANKQQNGLRWPAYYKETDLQAAKALWIGCTNFTDEKGTFYTNKVAHVGPRVSGQGEVFPTRFKMYSRFAPPVVTVDGTLQLIDENVSVDSVDYSLAADRMIVNEVNTVLGVTMRRVIKYFSQQFHDNYILYEYTFTNTGNVDDDPVIELPNNTVTGFYAYFQWRYAVSRDVCYVIGNNPVQWGYNTMNDVRGDGVKNDPDDAISIPGVYSSSHMRISYSWHGKYPPFTEYDNIGGPIFIGYWDVTDTVGRLGGAQFVGNVTIHVDKSPSDTTDDITQPVTTDYVNSDDALTRGNSHTDMAKMQQEYVWMTKGHASPRHADVVEPTGAFDTPTGDPSLGRYGGNSSTTGYGPWTLKPGESVRIVLAEGAAGLSRQACYSVGLKYMNGKRYNPPRTPNIDAKAKNDSVLTGKDSLFQTFRRAIANYRTGHAIPREPFPPREFAVTSGADRIELSWLAPIGGPTVTGYRIYRAIGKQDTIFTKIAEVGAGTTLYNDTAVVRGVKHYYYIESVGADRPTDPNTLTPGGALVSNRQYTQTGGPTGQGAVLKRAPGATMTDIRIVPNPFSLGADPNLLRFKGEPDKIAFYNIPGQCRIKIYTELGELVKEIEHLDGSGDEYWNSTTSSNQVVVSGIYLVVFEDLKTGDRAIRKLSVIR